MDFRTTKIQYINETKSILLVKFDKMHFASAMFKQACMAFGL